MIVDGTFSMCLVSCCIFMHPQSMNLVLILEEMEFLLKALSLLGVHHSQLSILPQGNPCCCRYLSDILNPDFFSDYQGFSHPGHQILIFYFKILKNLFIVSEIFLILEVLLKCGWICGIQIPCLFQSAGTGNPQKSGKINFFQIIGIFWTWPAETYSDLILQVKIQ